MDYFWCRFKSKLTFTFPSLFLRRVNRLTTAVAFKCSVCKPLGHIRARASGTQSGQQTFGVFKTHSGGLNHVLNLVFFVVITAAYGRQTSIITSIFSSEAAGFVILKRLRLDWLFSSGLGCFRAPSAWVNGGFPVRIFWRINSRGIVVQGVCSWYLEPYIRL